MKRSVVFIMVFITHLTLQAQIDVNWLLIARNSGTYIAVDGYEVRIMGYTQTIGSAVYIPGPTLHATSGDSVKLRLFNLSQGPPHTVHLHGLDVNQQNDGVPQFSFEVEHDSSGYYYFKAPHPGTYLYHCHVVSPVHVQGGMYGLIVIDAEDPQMTANVGGFHFDKEYNWLASEIDTIWHNDTIIDHEHDPGMMHKIPKHYIPQYFLINGAMNEQMEVKGGIHIHEGKDTEILIRIANIGNYANRYVFPSQLNIKQLSSDGRPLPTIIVNDTLWVFPGERYQVIGKPTEDFESQVQVDYYSLLLDESKGTQFIDVKIEGQNQIDEPQKTPIALYPNPCSSELYLSVSEFNFTIYDLSGAIIKQGTCLTGVIPVESLINTMYLIELELKDGTKTTCFFQKIDS